MNFCTGMAKQLLLKEVGKGFDKNLVVSPLSINAVLNMVASGSTGRTLEQMLGSLGANNIDDINSKSADMMAFASSGGKDGPILSFVNGVWVDQRFPLKPSYQDLVRDIYKTEAKNVDFENKADEVVTEVNSWANNASKGLIKNILQPKSIDPLTLLIIANGLYFKGIWSDEFNPKRTENREFYLLDGETVSVPFMTSNKTYLYGSFDGFKVLQIPYQSGEEDKRRFSMYFFLPDQRDGLLNLLEKFNSDPGFIHQRFNLSKEKLDEFWIPKFKFSYGFEASVTIQEMGLTLPFMEDNVEITEMVQIPKDLPFFISRIIHKAFIEVDEKGTEAAAITLGRYCGRARFQKRENFVADHPFMFMIREDKSGLVFFTGAVLNPIRND